jgi:hypothetical protein
MKTTTRLAFVGLVLLLPACILVSSGTLGFDVAPQLVHPVAVMGGLLAAFILNLAAVLQWRAEREQTGNITAITVRIGAQPLNLALIVFSTLLLSAILAYAFVENFRPR